MRLVRLSAAALAVALFAAAALWPDGVPLPGLGPGPTGTLRPMTAFWCGVALLLLAAWGRGT